MTMIITLLWLAVKWSCVTGIIIGSYGITVPVTPRLWISTNQNMIENTKTLFIIMPGTTDTATVPILLKTADY